MIRSRQVLLVILIGGALVAGCVLRQPRPVNQAPLDSANLATSATTTRVIDGDTVAGPGSSNLVLSGTVVHVVDGDTADVRLDSGTIRVRFHGIDAPEGKAPFGREATATLRARLPVGKEVELLPVEQDRYERLVAVVYADGISVNEAMVASGHAWAYRQYLGQVPGDEVLRTGGCRPRGAPRALVAASPALGPALDLPATAKRATRGTGAIPGLLR